MPTYPVPSGTSSWPNSIASFVPVEDFAGPTSTIFAATMNAIFSEIVALEAGLGPSPFAGTPYSTLAQALSDLYYNKSPSIHGHNHTDLVGDASGDDHLQYARVDGSRPFTAPVTAPGAVVGTQLATLAQVLGSGYLTSSVATAQINAATANLVRGASSGNGVLWGSIPGNPQWAFYGGTTAVNADGAGAVTVTWPGFPNATVGFTGACMVGGEVSITLTGAGPNSARVVFVNAFGNPMPGSFVEFSWNVFGC